MGLGGMQVVGWERERQFGAWLRVGMGTGVEGGPHPPPLGYAPPGPLFTINCVNSCFDPPAPP